MAVSTVIARPFPSFLHTTHAPKMQIYTWSSLLYQEKGRVTGIAIQTAKAIVLYFFQEMLCINWIYTTIMLFRYLDHDSRVQTLTEQLQAARLSPTDIQA